MGNFLSFALVHKSINELKKGVLEYSRINQGNYLNIPDQYLEENNILFSKVKPLDKRTSIVLFPTFNEEQYNCSKFISTSLNTKVLATHIYDGNVWLIYLFKNGKELTKYASNPNLIEESKEDWHLNSEMIISNYEISPNLLDAFLQNQDFNNEGDNATAELFEFLKDLGYEIEIIQDSDNGYKSLLSSKELKRITKKFLTIEDLQKAKKYSSELIKLSEEEVYELFADEFNFITSSQLCENCGEVTLEKEYYLSVDTLCLQIKGLCKSCQGKFDVLFNYAFIHKMVEVRNFLNK